MRADTAYDCFKERVGEGAGHHSGWRCADIDLNSS